MLIAIAKLHIFSHQGKTPTASQAPRSCGGGGGVDLNVGRGPLWIECLEQLATVLHEQLLDRGVSSLAYRVAMLYDGGMQLNEYLAQDGAQAKMAADLAISTAQVWQWKDGRRPVPHEYGAAIERATDGKVTRKDLFPNSWERVWPELATKTTETTGATS